jgi:hypothetical protein
MSYHKYASISVHRIILMQKIGTGPQSCHWCGKPVEWKPVKKGKGGWDGVLIVDHVNNISSDNSPDNLVPACFRCNVFRQIDEDMKKSPYIITKAGFRQKAIPRNCAVCGKEFLLRISSITGASLKNRPGNGKYCSFKCQCAARTIAFKNAAANTVDVTGGRGTNKTVAIKQICQYCKGEFLGTPTDIKRGRRYCSTSCGGRARNAGFPIRGRRNRLVKSDSHSEKIESA